MMCCMFWTVVLCTSDPGYIHEDRTSRPQQLDKGVRSSGTQVVVWQIQLRPIVFKSLDNKDSVFVVQSAALETQ